MKKSTVQTDPRIQTVIDYIMLNPTEEYTSDKLSGMAEVAETTFRRLFKGGHREDRHRVYTPGASDHGSQTSAGFQ